MDRKTIEEARAKLGDLADAAARGEPTTLTRRGRPVAEVVPVGTWDSFQCREARLDTSIRSGDEVVADLSVTGPSLRMPRRYEPTPWLRAVLPREPTAGSDGIARVLLTPAEWSAARERMREGVELAECTPAEPRYEDGAMLQGTLTIGGESVTVWTRPGVDDAD